VYLIWDTYFCASFLGSLCTELVRNRYTKGFEVAGADFCACVKACFTPYAGLPHLDFAPAFAAPLKAGDVRFNYHAVCGQVDVLFHVASPIAGESLSQGSARRRVAQQAQHAVLAEVPIADDTYGARSAGGASRFRLTTQGLGGC